MDFIVALFGHIIAFMGTQLAGNLITLIAALVASLVFVRQGQHANHVRDLTFISNQQNILSALARAIVKPEKTDEYDVAMLLAAMEQTAHAFNARLVGVIAVDYLRPQFLRLLEWSMLHPGVVARWNGAGPDGYIEIRRFMFDMKISEDDLMKEETVVGGPATLIPGTPPGM